MKSLLKAAFLILVIGSSVSAQSNKAERDIENLLAAYEQAVIKLDIAFLERVWADDFIYSGANGTTQTRKQSLEYLKEEKDAPTAKIISYKTANRKVRVMGSAAMATGDWTLQSAAVDSSANEPHTDQGRITIILEKRDGKWLIVAEHESE